jgi:hypothetical protein
MPAPKAGTITKLGDNPINHSPILRSPKGLHSGIEPDPRGPQPPMLPLHQRNHKQCIEAKCNISITLSKNN